MSPSAPRSRVGPPRWRRGVDGGSVDQHRAGAGAHHGQTTVAELLEQLQHVHNDTLEHQHLALSDIHRATGHEQLFDTLFVYENYPIDTAALSGADGLAITEFTTREYNHYPLSVVAVPAASWCFASNSTPRCSMRPASRRSPSGCGGCWWR
ncbi:linear gramicidin synthetase subunit C domain protein [Mycobacterium xenopi 4042]|uniref:Linear gramicidin synthetase subunit C domain protein n=1 Tax=Mycobacterium xenopi 4042 TaxID=1299334 RepID=X8DKY7_MYCXE|nr:linear gramicidin synthetase subunit C domain protein [Mycobacterium xenopi 4042]